MKNALNKSIIDGRVVRVPTLKQTKTGIAYCSVIVAVNHTFVAAGEKKQDTSYITVSVWNKTAAACAAYLKKGQRVRVEGKLRQCVWTDGSGIKHARLEINCEKITFLERSRAHAPANVTGGASQENAELQPDVMWAADRSAANG